jgi:hypothetical protein
MSEDKVLSPKLSVCFFYCKFITFFRPNFKLRESSGINTLSKTRLNNSQVKDKYNIYLGIKKALYVVESFKVYLTLVLNAIYTNWHMPL